MSRFHLGRHLFHWTQLLRLLEPKHHFFELKQLTCWYLIQLYFLNKSSPRRPTPNVFPHSTHFIMSVISPPQGGKGHTSPTHPSLLMEIQLLLGLWLTVSTRQVLPKPFHGSDLCASKEPMASNGTSTSIRGWARQGRWNGRMWVERWIFFWEGFFGKL